MFAPARLFRSGMVLQREKPVSVWGTADPGQRITVTVQNRTASTITEETGLWRLTLPPLETSFCETMTLSDGVESLVFDDVQVGEVWLLGGQSNMEFHMRYDFDFVREQSECRDDALRFFDYPEVSYPEQVHEADFWKEYGFWRKAEPLQLERFSAVGYYFGKKLRRELNVPVGLIGCNWGGTPACAWMRRETVLTNGGAAFVEEYDKALGTLDLEDYERRFRKDPTGWKTDQLAHPIADAMMFGATVSQMLKQMQELGIDPQSWGSMIGPKWERRPGGLYESMLLPLAPYALRGFLYYQGETDGDTHPEAYEALFPALIREWRTLWNEELPFLFVQIAPLERWMACVGEPYVTIRAAQQETADTVPNTGMAVVTDAGMRWDIHPKKKQPVGERLALQALSRVYGKDLLCEAPRLASMHVEGKALCLRFANAGRGLYLNRWTPYGEPAPAGCAGWLRLFQNGEELDGTKITPIAGDGCLYLIGPVFDPKAGYRVELAQSGWYQVPLYNSANIPARPGILENNQWRKSQWKTSESV